MASTLEGHLSIGEAAERLGVQHWRLARLYKRGLLPELPRVAGARVVRESDLPTIARALREAGYLREHGRG